MCLELDRGCIKQELSSTMEISFIFQTGKLNPRKVSQLAQFTAWLLPICRYEALFHLDTSYTVSLPQDFWCSKCRVMPTLPFSIYYLRNLHCKYMWKYFENKTLSLINIFIFKVLLWWKLWVKSICIAKKLLLSFPL